METNPELCLEGGYESERTNKKSNKGDCEADEIYLEYDGGYRSWQVKSKHCSYLRINNRSCDITYVGGPTAYERVHKIIDTKNYRDLISVFSKYKQILSEDDVPSHVRFPFGGWGAYKYKFAGKSNFSGCAHLFESDNQALESQARIAYNAVIANILDQ